MTDIEKRIADYCFKHYDEEEYSEPYSDYRVYVDMNGVISSQDEMTDVLFFHYTENEETGEKYIQLFISSPDDMAQDFVYLHNLTEEEQNCVTTLFFEQAQA